MPNIKVKAGAGAAKATKEVVGYVGKRPPKGLYRVLVKRLTLTVNKNGDLMLNAVLEINEPKGSPKAKFNKYGFWWNGNITEDGAGYINQFLDSISGGKQAVKDALWSGKLRTFDMPKKGHKATVMAIGPMKVQQEGMPAVVSTRLAKPYNGEQNLAVADWLLPSQAEEIEAADDYVPTDEEEDAAEAEMDEEAVDVEDFVNDPDGEVIEAEYTDEDEDDEPPF